jgi:hypothetical protein
MTQTARHTALSPPLPLVQLDRNATVQPCVHSKRIEQCAPITFRTAPPDSGRALIADWGTMTFGGKSAAGRPHFIHLADSRMPHRTMSQYTAQSESHGANPP